MSAPAGYETRPWSEQQAADEEPYRCQLAYLIERSAFYREKLGAAGIESASDAGGLERLPELPLTEKSELREARSESNPIGEHLCVERAEVVRIYSTSGTTGTPSYIPLTAQDVDSWVTGSARSYGASGIVADECVVSTYGAGPFVAGAGLQAFESLGLTHVPVGPGNAERLLRAIEELRPDALALTPSYATHLLERAAERGRDLGSSSVVRLLVAGEPGGGESGLRRRLEEGWGARVTEAMGVGDIGPTLWGECEAQQGMHLGARGFVHAELIDATEGSALELADGAEGELVLTHLRQRAAPLLRFRTRDHVTVAMGECECGRTGPRIRCVGRTDDMLIVRGVNVFPSAVREVAAGFAPEVSGNVLLEPAAVGVRQEPPVPVKVELERGSSSSDELARSLASRLRESLGARFAIELVAWGSLGRSDYKSRLIKWPEGE